MSAPKVTLPIQHVATGDSFWAQARAECSVLGVVLFLPHLDGSLVKRGVVLVSECIEHTAIAAGVQSNIVREMLGNKAQGSHLKVWADCGPHYRNADFISYFGFEWVLKLDCRVALSYFTEKHGKGAVDSLFSTVNQWCGRFARKEGTSIESVPDFVSAMQEEARLDQAKDPKGLQYTIVHWKAPSKPVQAWRGVAPKGFYITRTYCLEGSAYGLQRDQLHWKNHKFSDLTKGETIQFQFFKEPIDDREWRKGFFTNPRWKRQFPQRHSQSAILERHAMLQDHDVELPDKDDLSNRLGRYQRGLQIKRARACSMPSLVGLHSTCRRICCHTAKP